LDINPGEISEYDLFGFDSGYMEEDLIKICFPLLTKYQRKHPVTPSFFQPLQLLEKLKPTKIMHQSGKSLYLKVTCS